MKYILLVLLILLSSCSDFFIAGIERKGIDDISRLKDTIDIISPADSLWLHDPFEVIPENSIIDTMIKIDEDIGEGWQLQLSYVQFETSRYLISMRSSQPLQGVHNSADSSYNISFSNTKQKSEYVNSTKIVLNAVQGEMYFNSTTSTPLSGVILQVRESQYNIVSTYSGRLFNVIDMNSIESIGPNEAIWISNIQIQDGDSLLGSFTNSQLDYYILPSTEIFDFENANSLYSSKLYGEKVALKCVQNQEVSVLVYNKSSQIQELYNTDTLTIIRQLSN